MEGIPFSRRPLAHCGTLLLMALLLLLLELALEWRAHQRGFDTLLLGSGQTGQHADDYPFRSPPVAAEKSAGVTRLWIAGASHAEDSYLPVDAIFPTLTCHQMQQTGQRCDVINGSEAGTGIEGNLAVLAHYGPIYRPDIVLLYQGSIEIQDLSKLSFAPVPTSSGEAPDAWHRGTLDPIQQVLEATTLFAHLSQGVRTRLMAAKQLEDGLPAPALAIFRQRLQQFLATARALGAQPVLSTFAARYTSDQYAAFDDELFRSQLRYNPFLSRRGWLVSIDQLNQEIRAVAAAEQVPLLDVAAVLAGDAAVFRDFSHFSKLGHQRVAATLAAGLQPLWSQRAPLASVHTGATP